MRRNPWHPGEACLTRRKTTRIRRLKDAAFLVLEAELVARGKPPRTVDFNDRIAKNAGEVIDLLDGAIIRRKQQIADA